MLKQRQTVDNSLSQEEAVAFFPPSMHNMRKLPIPFSYAFKDDDIDKELKRVKKQRSATQRQVASQLNKIMTNMSHGGGSSDTEEDDNDLSSYCLSNKDALDITDAEWNEESLTTGEDVDIVEDLIEEDDISNLIEMSSFSDEQCRDIKLCEFVSESIRDASKRASIRGITDIPADYKLERAKVFQHLRDLLDGKDGPNESIESKLLQLRMQEDMHKKFIDGEIKKSLLSHYLLHTRAQRLVLINNLEHAVAMKMQKSDLKWPAKPLAKLPPGKDGLGDRGFEGTSPSYPHCNAMKTPNFLEGRD